MSAIVLLQARTSSSRLPGKVLLPISGVPLAVLAAKRAANTGLPVKVVTSTDASDDVLCDVLAEWRVPYFRGSLKDTLKRFVDAIGSAPDEQIVVRLTGDNVFPDGQFIDGMLEAFESCQLQYMNCAGEGSGLPYGVSAEITRAGHIRAAHRSTGSESDREHVTPWIIRKFGAVGYDKYRTRALSQYRCTVDTLDDYLRVSQVFRAENEPEAVTLDALVERLVQLSSDVIVAKPASKLVLGTAQLGLNYGIANQSGKPDSQAAKALVRMAVSNGVGYLDTAHAYGNSEQVLGEALAGGWASRVTTITKLSPLDSCPDGASEQVVQAFVTSSVFQSCRALKRGSLDVLMLHRARHLWDWNGAAWRALLELRDEGAIGQLGVSVQSPDEALQALDVRDVNFIQLPFNILDDRWDRVIEKLEDVRQDRAITVHARSSLLQGLLATSQESLWERAHCVDPEPVIRWLQGSANKLTQGDVAELCLKYVLSQGWINGVVIGVDNLDQLAQNLECATCDLFTEAQLTAVSADRPKLSEATLNPANWKSE